MSIVTDRNVTKPQSKLRHKVIYLHRYCGVPRLDGVVCPGEGATGAHRIRYAGNKTDALVFLMFGNCGLALTQPDQTSTETFSLR